MGVVKRKAANPRLSLPSGKRQRTSGGHKTGYFPVSFLKNKLVTILQWYVKCVLTSLLIFFIFKDLLHFLNYVYGVRLYVYRSAGAHRGQRGH